MAFQRVGIMYQSGRIPVLHRGCKHHHKRLGDRYTSACAKSDEAHSTRSHATHGADPPGHGVSTGVPEALM